MRILVDLVDDQVRALDDVARAGRRSRAAVLREAVDAYLSKVRTRSTALDDAFGLWDDREVDGLAYQKRLRSEW